MPTSACEGREWVYERIRDTTAPWIIDAGAGEGTYSVLARHTRLDARWCAIEAHEGYVDRFLLGQKYDDVIVCDIRQWRPELEDGYVLLLGDVLEHMPRADAVDLLGFHLERAAELMVSVPIVYAPQGACYGNGLEEHVHHYHFEEMLELLGPDCESWRGQTVGRYWVKRDD